jgi:hypothetical protein
MNKSATEYIDLWKKHGVFESCQWPLFHQNATVEQLHCMADGEAK